MEFSYEEIEFLLEQLIDCSTNVKTVGSFTYFRSLVGRRVFLGDLWTIARANGIEGRRIL